MRARLQGLRPVLVAVVIVAPVVAAIPFVQGGSAHAAWLHALLSALWATVAYRTFQKRLPELGLPLPVGGPALAEFLAGAGLGVLLITLVTTVLCGAGLAQLQRGDQHDLLLAVTNAMAAAALEEVIFRGLLFGLLLKYVGEREVLLVTSVAFGALHLLTPQSSVLSCIAIAVQAGVLLGIAALYRGTLAFPIGIHFSWNAAQTAVLGLPLAGHDYGGVLELRLADSWISGRAQGLEASPVTLILCLAAAVVMWELRDQLARDSSS